MHSVTRKSWRKWHRITTEPSLSPAFYEASFVYGLQNIYVDHNSRHLGFTPVHIWSSDFPAAEVHVDYHQLFPYSNIETYFRQVCVKKKRKKKGKLMSEEGLGQKLFK